MGKKLDNHVNGKENYKSFKMKQKTEKILGQYSTYKFSGLQPQAFDGFHLNL